MSPVEPGQLGPGRVILVLLTIALNVLGQQEQACAVDLETSSVASMFCWIHSESPPLLLHSPENSMMSIYPQGDRDLHTFSGDISGEDPSSSCLLHI